jgi:DNA ligase D-like protein (predicted ligase)/DNA ligase D-like protein (predicted 3'-phosphoesterase)
MLAKEAKEPFSGADWLFEIKWDGFRALAYVDDAVSLRSRNYKELIENFPELQELTQQSKGVVLDGEIVVLKEGKVDFQSLLERGKATSPTDITLKATHLPVVYVVFDILEKAEQPVVDLPLTERKSILKKTVKETEHVILADYVEEKGEAYYEAIMQKGLEGLIAKKKNSPYEAGVRSGNWLKIKKLRSCACVLFGYREGTGARKNTVGAVLLGLYDYAGKAVFVGKVGTGFSQENLKTLLTKFQKKTSGEAPFEADVAEKVTWIEPELVCEVAYQVVTKDRRLRMPRFLRIRTDKKTKECTISQLAEAKPLEEYEAKRDFAKTTEPKAEKPRKGEAKIFVVQEHHARRLHYDFRLERDGVLKSWAVPKGIPETPDEKRLAVQVEDHPVEYAKFEGEIPKGEYGAGKVIIWDKGTYETKVWDEKMVEVILEGTKLRGRFVLVPIKRAGEKNWLMLKAKK